MKIAGSPSPGTPGEIMQFGCAASILVKSPAFCGLKEARNSISPQASLGVGGSHTKTIGGTYEKPLAVQ